MMENGLISHFLCRVLVSLSIIAAFSKHDGCIDKSLLFLFGLVSAH